MMRLPQSGFTLVELLVVIVIVGLLATAVLFAINPLKNINRAHDAKRHNDVDAIASAVYYYVTDSSEGFPQAIPTADACNTDASQEICRTGGNCNGLVDLSVLTTNQKYFVAMPIDPASQNSNGTGYLIAKNSNNRIMICAPLTQDGPMISVTR